MENIGFTYIQGINIKTNKYFITRYKGDTKTAINKLKEDLINPSKPFLFGYIITKPTRKAYKVNKEEIKVFKVLYPLDIKNKIRKNLEKQNEYRDEDQVEDIFLKLRVYK